MLQEGNVIMQPDGEVDIPVRRPDGDVELKGAGEHFYFPPCAECGGILKPNVVFFGDTIPKPRALRYDFWPAPILPFPASNTVRIVCSVRLCAITPGFRTQVLWVKPERDGEW